MDAGVGSAETGQGPHYPTSGRLFSGFTSLKDPSSMIGGRSRGKGRSRARLVKPRDRQDERVSSAQEDLFCFFTAVAWSSSDSLRAAE